LVPAETGIIVDFTKQQLILKCQQYFMTRRYVFLKVLKLENILQKYWNGTINENQSLVLGGRNQLTKLQGKKNLPKFEYTDSVNQYIPSLFSCYLFNEIVINILCIKSKMIINSGTLRDISSIPIILASGPVY